MECNYSDIKLAAYTANMQLPVLGLVFFTFGNVSAADRTKGVFAIKPSGVPYNELKVEDMVVVDFDGKIVEGSLKPSSDTQTHAVLYKNWEHIGGIAYSHSKYATAWAQTLRDIPIYGTTHAEHNMADIPCTPPMSDKMIKGNYELETGNQIIEFFEKKGLDYNQLRMVLVGNRAPFTWGKDAAEAVYNSAVLESIAHMAYLTLQINPSTQRLRPALIQKHYERKHGSIHQ